jgi:hypothetical protein
MKSVAIISEMLFLGLACTGCVTKTVAFGASGVVLDSQTSTPLADCSVSVTGLHGRGRIVRTRSDGAFAIAPVKRTYSVFLMGDTWPSRHLEVNRDGYQTATLDLSTRRSPLQVMLIPVTK